MRYTLNNVQATYILRLPLFARLVILLVFVQSQNDEALSTTSILFYVIIWN